MQNTIFIRISPFNQLIYRQNYTLLAIKNRVFIIGISFFIFFYNIFLHGKINNKVAPPLIAHKVQKIIIPANHTWHTGIKLLKLIPNLLRSVHHIKNHLRWFNSFHSVRQTSSKMHYTTRKQSYRLSVGSNF